MDDSNNDNNKRQPDDRRRIMRPPQKAKRPGQPAKNEDDFNWNKVLKVVISWSAIILLVFVVMTLFKGTEATEVELTYTEYQSFLAKNMIAEAVIKKSDIANYDFHGILR